ncbi:DNA-3-methyladenine glycosylase [Nocardioides limicola]|uniref:DNA-3-methyladenine glycosylase n=1 Tax=Nocardioides limicola TaxID=2803368 RepID=UPI0027DC1941|nr:DNA-3-methyladenine glycosylase [Nocardioides sp. DJM-14]
MSGEPFTWLTGEPDQVAPRLLGALVSTSRDGGVVTVRITEVEAYGGFDDEASHACAGPTRRNQPMFGPPGTVYVYLSHGLHHCLNVTTGTAGEPGAVLIRAGEVVEGIPLARARRGGRDRDLARGPGRLGQCLALSLDDTGTMLGHGVAIRAPAVPAGEVLRGPRVGVRRAADRPWRYWLAGDTTVSGYRRHPRVDSGPGLV